MLTYFRYVDGHIERRDAVRKEDLPGPEGSVHWVDLQEPTPEECKVLDEVFSVHPLAIEDTFAEVHHPKVDEYDEQLFIIVHGVRFDVPSERLVTSKLSVVLGRNYLITHHAAPLASIDVAREQCRRDLNPAMPKGADFLLHQILDKLFERYFPNLEMLQDKIQLVEAEVFHEPTQDTLSRIFQLKRDVLDVRRVCTPQREIANRLSRGEFDLIGRKASVYFRDIYDDLYRLVDVSYFYQDMVQATLDAYLNAVSNKLNETMRRLTVIGAVLMPLTLVTGIYGMNFHYMPELGYRYGYFTVLGLMLALSVGLIVWFKHKGWV